MMVDFDKARNMIVLTGRYWSDSFPPEQLGSKLALYRGLRDRAGGQYARHYEGTVKGLEQAAQDAQASSFSSRQ